MECIKTRAIVARRADYGESNCMLTLFSEDLGTVSACVYGVKSKKSRMKAASQQLCFAEFVLSKGKGDIYRADSADIIESFYPVFEDIKKLALANYLMDITNDFYSETDSGILSLLLNTLYAIAYKNVEESLAKAVFELKIMQYSGYGPVLDHCVKCGDRDNISFFDISGGVVCGGCVSGIPISEDVLSAMRYILSSDAKKLFSFVLSEDAKASLSELCEKYIQNQSEKRYKSLEYYKKI